MCRINLVLFDKNPESVCLLHSRSPGLLSEQFVMSQITPAGPASQEVSVNNCLESLSTHQSFYIVELKY